YEYASGVDPEAPSQLTSRVGAPPVTYDYDISGNVVERDDNGSASGSYTFLYDGEDQQRIATAPSGDQELYYYDESGKRILAVSRQPGGTITKVRLWFGSTEIEYDGAGQAQKTLAHLSLGGIPIARVEDLVDATYVVHGHLGHMLGALSLDGSALDAGFIYGPFGEILAETGVASDYLRRFNGKEHDQLTDLYYYGFRYFDPLSLTWTQADPLYRFAPDLAYDEPRRMNLYAFSLQNPVRYVDPDGRAVVAGAVAACGAAPAACAAAAAAVVGAAH